MANPFDPTGRTSWWRNVFAPPQIPHPPAGPPTPVGRVPGQPLSLHDPAISALPRSPNLEDRRFDPHPSMLDYLRTVLGMPPGSGPMQGPKMPFVGVPASTGPAPQGNPYPTAPTPYAGTTIQAQRLDPRTTMLSNVPPSSAGGAFPAAPTPPPPTSAQVTRAQGDLENLGIGGPPSPGPMTTSDLRGVYKQLDTLLKANEKRQRGAPNLQMPQEALGTLDALVSGGYITIYPTDYDTGLQFPGGTNGRDRLTRLVDNWRDWKRDQLEPSTGYHPQFWSGLTQPSPVSQNPMIPTGTTIGPDGRVITSYE